MSLVGLTKRTPVAETTVLSVSVTNNRMNHCSIILVVVTIGTSYMYEITCRSIQITSMYSQMIILHDAFVVAIKLGGSPCMHGDPPKASIRF